MLASVAMEPALRAIWQVEEGRGSWRDFPQHLNEKTEELFKNANTQHDGWIGFVYTWKVKGVFVNYAIDFTTIIQYKMSNDLELQVNTQRRIRRTMML